jgi:lysophospholipase L1-like esterase
MDMKLETGQKLLFIGDSITDAGRTGQFPPFGQGYVHFLRALVMSRRPDLALTFVNHGISGNTIRNLAARWATDVVAERPDHLFVMIGINDVWRHFGAGEQQGFHVPLAEFGATYEELLRRSGEAGIRGICLCGSFFVEPNREEPMRAMCDRYNAAVAELAKRLSLPFIDMQAVFDRLLESQHPMAIAPDRVHPNPHGHLAMAEEIYRVVWER